MTMPGLDLRILRTWKEGTSARVSASVRRTYTRAAGVSSKSPCWERWKFCRSG